MHKLDKLCQLGNKINFEYSENFPNSGFTSLIFPIGKALGPLPKIAKKIPDTCQLLPITTLWIKIEIFLLISKDKKENIICTMNDLIGGGGEGAF